jgi:osmotically-inducible protein OsmY
MTSKPRETFLLWGLFLWAIVPALILPCSADSPGSFYGYIDSDLCARLMLGPITTARVQCSQDTFKQGSDPVVVRLSDNLVLTPNKPKTIDKLVGQFAQISGSTKDKAGEVKIESAQPVEVAAIPKGERGLELLDVRTQRGENATLYEKVRHTLAMMPYISEFDFISFTMLGNDVILTGWTVRSTNRSEAFNRVKSIEGVGKITNNIDILPLGTMDMQIRARARANLHRYLSRYFWGSGSDIKIIVNRGDIILLGVVSSKADSDLANIQCKQVPGAFTVFNMLRVAPPAEKKTKQG